MQKYDVDIDSSKNPNAFSPIEKLNQKICGSHKRYDELFAQLKSKDIKLCEMEDQLDLLKKQEELIKASDKESEAIKVN